MTCLAIKKSLTLSFCTEFTQHLYPLITIQVHTKHVFFSFSYLLLVFGPIRGILIPRMSLILVYPGVLFLADKGTKVQWKYLWKRGEKTQIIYHRYDIYSSWVKICFSKCFWSERKEVFYDWIQWQCLHACKSEICIFKYLTNKNIITNIHIYSYNHQKFYVVKKLQNPCGIELYYFQIIIIMVHSFVQNILPLGTIIACQWLHLLSRWFYWLGVTFDCMGEWMNEYDVELLLSCILNRLKSTEKNSQDQSYLGEQTPDLGLFPPIWMDGWMLGIIRFKLTMKAWNIPSISNGERNMIPG